MKKKIVIGLSILLVMIILGGFLYVGIGKTTIENKMWDYLTQENYSETDIQSIEAKHSFANILLSYNEWTIDVVYVDEPTSIYKYTLKNGNIVESGVSGTTDKEGLKHLNKTTDKLIYGEPQEPSDNDIVYGEGEPLDIEGISQTKAEEIALEQCNVNYDYIKTEFNHSENLWSVEFWNTDRKIPTQTILIDTEGKIRNVIDCK